jgi:hypothetical protein
MLAILSIQSQIDNRKSKIVARRTAESFPMCQQGVGKTKPIKPAAADAVIIEARYSLRSGAARFVF